MFRGGAAETEEEQQADADHQQGGHQQHEGDGVVEGAAHLVVTVAVELDGGGAHRALGGEAEREEKKQGQIFSHGRLGGDFKEFIQRTPGVYQT